MSRAAPAQPQHTAPSATTQAREKSRDAFRTISEVAEELDVPAHVLRFWESKFPQLQPMKRGGGRRYYRPADIALLHGIRAHLYDDGLTIKGLQKIFRERGPRHISARGGAPAPAPAAAPEAPAAPAVTSRAALIHALEGVRDRLRAGPARV